MDPIQTLVNNAGGDYNLVERIGAGLHHEHDQFRPVSLNTGVRFESTTENVLGTVLSQDDQGNFLGVSAADEELYLRQYSAQRANFASDCGAMPRSGLRTAGESHGRNSATWRQIYR